MKRCSQCFQTALLAPYTMDTLFSGTDVLARCFSHTVSNRPAIVPPWTRSFSSCPIACTQCPLQMTCSLECYCASRSGSTLPAHSSGCHLECLRLATAGTHVLRTGCPHGTCTALSRSRQQYQQLILMVYLRTYRLPCCGCTTYVVASVLLCCTSGERRTTRPQASHA